MVLFPAKAARPQGKGRRISLNNSIFKLRDLHDHVATKSSAARNNLGFVNSDTATAAHMPSYLFWLFHRGGIPFEEAQQLCAAKRLLLDNKPITDEGFLQRQIPWREMAAQNFKVVNDRGVPCDPVQRARHRTYAIMCLSKSMSFVPEEENPRSLIHSIPFLDPPSAKSYHVLSPAGFVNSMRGLILITNDAHIRPLWRNEFLGNWGRYDLRFHAGAPDEAVEHVRMLCVESIKKQSYSSDIKVKPQVVIDKKIPKKGNDGVARLVSTPLRSDVRLIVDTPLLDFRLFSQIRRDIAHCTLIRNGPFDTPLETLPFGSPRKLHLEELEQLFAFERKLKTNKIVYGLRTLQSDEGSGDPLEGLTQHAGDNGRPFTDDDISDDNSDI